MPSTIDATTIDFAFIDIFEAEPLSEAAPSTTIYTFDSTSDSDSGFDSNDEEESMEALFRDMVNARACTEPPPVPEPEDIYDDKLKVGDYIDVRGFNKYTMRSEFEEPNKASDGEEEPDNADMSESRYASVVRTFLRTPSATPEPTTLEKRKAEIALNPKGAKRHRTIVDLTKSPYTETIELPSGTA